MKTIISRVILLLAVALVGACATARAEVWTGEMNTASERIDLSGGWRFQVDPTNVGLQEGWQSEAYDYSSWKTIGVPGSWESQGITVPNPGWDQDDLNQPYSGYAWYRRTIDVPADWKASPGFVVSMYLNLGRIDDTDWVYVNGTLVGHTSNLSAPTSDFYRSYEVPENIIRFGQPNVVVVRVLDTRGEGGILEGPISLSTTKPEDYGRLRNPGREDKVQFLGNIVVGPDETVGDAVAIGGSITVRGRVTGDAVAVGGSVRIMPGGHVSGDVVAVGGTVTKEPGAIVGGDTQGIGVGGWGWHGPTDWRELLALDLRVRLFKLLGAALFAGLGALLVALFPARIGTVADVAISRPGNAVLFGLLVALLALPLAVLLLVTCIGIPLIAVEALLLVAAGVVGHVAIGLAVGRRIGDALHRPIASQVLATVVGVMVLALARMVPLAGDLVVWILLLIGFGATLATGFGSHAEWFERRMWHRTPPSA